MTTAETCPVVLDGNRSTPETLLTSLTRSLHFEPTTGMSTLVAVTSPTEGKVITSSASTNPTDLGFEKKSTLLAA
jgi:hypothetical protein